MPLNLGPRPQISKIAIPKMTDYGSIARMGKEESELDTLAKVERIKSSRLEQMKTAQNIQFGQDEEERARDMMKFKAASAYLDIINKGGTAEMADDAFREMGGTGTIRVGHVGRETNMSYTDNVTGQTISLKGPASQFANGGAVPNWLQIGANPNAGPEVAYDPVTGSVLASTGVDFKVEKAPQTPEEKMEDAKELARYKRDLGLGQTNITVNNISGKFFNKLGEEMAKKLVVERDETQGVVLAYKQLQPVKQLLDKGMVTGTGADLILSFGKGLQRLGVKAFDDPIANTEAYVSQMGHQVGRIIKQFGSGTGLSDADREYAEKIAGGKITLSKESLEKIISLNEKAMKNIVNNYNSKAKQVMLKDEARELPYDLMIEDIEGDGYGLRADGTEKGKGFLGELKRPDGKVSTELSVGVTFNGGQEIEIPLLVPTLDKDQIDYLLSGGKPTDGIMNKAVAHAKERIKAGKSPFAEEGEQKPKNEFKILNIWKK